ncbi:alpha/beta-hydrolase [Piedraia hortae CBS 480.64]|uniref:Dipeptidyl-peptidase V n=1 Tax=Piedraia hortae CBS 480.64 TaxID=1314780 RepID=A0A6A7C766_9PEZI|nr:alpha/beta-hydrolase [Piedraia hortae CBS 480.64]
MKLLYGVLLAVISLAQAANKLTPEVLLSAPRRSAGVPNANGTLIAYTVSAYSFEQHAGTSQIRVLNISSNQTQLVEEQSASSPNWISDHELVYLRSEDDGSTTLRFFDVSSSASAQSVSMIDADAENLKVVSLPGHAFGVAFTAEAHPNGSIVSPNAPKPLSSGKLYKSLMVRHWDRWETEERNSIWYAKMVQNQDKWSLSPIHNVLPNTTLESPIRPFGGPDNFDIRADAIVLTSKDPSINRALYTKTNIYTLSITDWANGTTSGLKQVVVEGYEGAKTYPIFAPTGKRLAFLAMKENGYESDQNHVLCMEDIDAKPDLVPTEGWDRSPEMISFTHDGRAILAVAEDEGYTKLFLLNGRVRALTDRGSITSINPLADGRVMVTSTSLVDSSLYRLLDTSGTGLAKVKWSNSLSGNGARFGISYDQVSSILTPASNPSIRKNVQAWVIRPSNYQKSRKYPLAFLIHGGPQSSWSDSWSTRWNQMIFAEQGYIVVSANPTGSTGFGQEFTDAIKQNWGGDPYLDLVNTFDWVSKNLPDVDTNRAVALGASYGGYVINWIQGHPLGRKFKCLVCHDGPLTLSGGMLATEELWFPFHDYGLPTWAGGKENTTSWPRWNPYDFIDNWSTPQLVIHSELDYRVPITEGLAAFNVLQTRGVESEFLTFSDENHWVLKPENSLVWHKTVLGWINQHVGM